MKPRSELRPIPEEAVRATAGIIGPYSASAAALRRADELRATGCTEVAFFEDGPTLLVTGRRPEAAAAA